MAEVPALIPAPVDSAQWPAWRRSLDEIRTSSITAEITGSYNRPEFAWIRKCVVCAKVMLFDREFYDPATNTFKVDTYIARLRHDYGSLDALVLWQAYPRIGFDERNQYDHYRLAPGLRSAIDRLHELGVKVFLAYNPWDTGTRREPENDAGAIAATVAHFDFDGVFLDTLQEGNTTLRHDLDKAKPGVVMESELALPASSMAANHASWAQWFDDGDVPGIMRNRWIERGHMMHVIRRWDLDHTGELQMAWMNGAGVLVWENIFGSWNGWNDRDKAILRSMIPVRRRYADLFDRGVWTPLVPTTLEGVYATHWSLGAADLWTLVNRTEQTVKGQALPLSSDGATRLFDLIGGKEIDHAVIEMAPRWVGAVLSVPSSSVDEGLHEFLRAQAKAFAPKADGMIRIEPLTTRIAVPRSSSKNATQEMVIVEAGERTVVSRMRARECGEYGPAHYGGSSYIPIHYERKIGQVVRLGRFAVCRREVTKREFQAFVASGYKPASKDSFLLGGGLDEPVCYVSLEDARAYAKWVGMRLPTELEWQIAVAEHDLEHGKVWNWTESEHFDGHTSFSILKGGCHWKAEGSDWYADSGPQEPDWSAKYIHFFPSLDRCSTIGFRCAIDL